MLPRVQQPFNGLFGLRVVAPMQQLRWYLPAQIPVPHHPAGFDEQHGGNLNHFLLCTHVPVLALAPRHGDSSGGLGVALREVDAGRSFLTRAPMLSVWIRM